MFEGQYRNQSAPLHWRIALFAIDNHARPLEKGELWASVDPFTRSAEISRAIKKAKDLHLITPQSSASVLYSLLLDTDEIAS